MSKASAYLQEVEEEMEACKCSEERKKFLQSEMKTEEENIRIKAKNEYLDKKIDEKQTKLDEVNKDFNDLRVEDQKLVNENNCLKKQVKELQQYKLRSQKEKLQKLVWRRRGAEREEFKKLCAAYEKLEQSSKKEERDEARIEKDNLEKNIEEKLLTNEVHFEDIQTLFKMCEDIAKSQVELQAFIEVSPRSHLG